MFLDKFPALFKPPEPVGHAQTIDQGLFPPPEVRIEYVFSESDKQILKDQAMMKKDLTEKIQKMHQAYQQK